ncbi:GntP family permease [Virgibacillus xinjiangensis]|uniref:GntP family permease n=1 Tax=Virgibacillus xinjiangensis TaxID=393090 RepID=A0ABV7D082_9BACI
MEFYSVAVIIFSLAFLMFLALKGFSIIIIAPMASLVVVFLTQMPLLETLEETYMGGFINFAKNFYLIFLFAALFGKFMDDSGAARVIAEGILKAIGRKSKLRVLIAIVAICGLLTYGGINVYVVIFAVLPIAKPLFKELDIPWHLFMAAFFFGSATFTMTMLPGTPSIQNIIPTEYFGTTVGAAPLVGIVAAIFLITFNLYYLKHILKKSEINGETYDSMKNLEQTTDNEEERSYQTKRKPHFLVSLIPPASLLILLNLFHIEVLYALMLSVLLCIAIFWPYIEKKIRTINVGATNTVLPIVNTSADVGYGAVIAASTGFAVLSQALTDIPGSPLISLYLSTSLLAGITGSASGGLGIAMEALSQTYLDLGLHPEVLHRIAVIGSSGFDALPHNGGVITFLAVAGLTHKDAYKHIFMTGIIAPTLAAVPALLTAILFY